jgi:hypothetical protein
MYPCTLLIAANSSHVVPNTVLANPNPMLDLLNPELPIPSL